MENYNKKLRKFFIVKAVALSFGLITLLVYLFAPLLRFEGGVSSYFELFISLFKALISDNGVLKSGFSGDEEFEFVKTYIAMYIFGSAAIFYLVVFLKIIFVVKNLIKSICAVNNENIYVKIADEISLIKSDHISKRAAKNYKKLRKINGCSLIFIVITILTIIFFAEVSVGLDLLIEMGIDLTAVGLSGVYAVVESGDAMILPTVLSILFVVVNFIFSLIVYIYKCKTRYSVYKDTNNEN